MTNTILSGVGEPGLTPLEEQVARAIFPSVCPFAEVGCCNEPDFDRCKECASDTVEIARDAIEVIRIGILAAIENAGGCGEQSDFSAGMDAAVRNCERAILKCLSSSDAQRSGS